LTPDLWIFVFAGRTFIMPNPYLVLRKSVMSVPALRSEMVRCAIASALVCSHDRAVEVALVREAPETQ
jgi:hypothetical protein